MKWWFAACLAACSRVPPHLRPPDPAPEVASAPITSTDDLTSALIGQDPLARRLPKVNVVQVRSLPGGGPYADFLEVTAAASISDPSTLARVEAIESSGRGTLLVPLSRGARLREMEGLLGGVAFPAEDVGSVLLDLATPLGRTSADRSAALRPLHWLDEPDARRPVLDEADRWVLAGWLDAPNLDLEPAARALRGSAQDSLRETPLAKLILARSGGGRSDARGAWADVQRATELFLHFAARDRNQEQAASATLREKLRAELGPGDPVATLLDRAVQPLIDDAADDRSAGAAKLAIHARRLLPGCAPAPCRGLHRMDGIVAAGRWSPEVKRLSRLWLLARLEEALDGLAVAQGTARYPLVVVDLVDALLAAGAVPSDPTLLRQRRPDATTWLALGRAVGEEQATTQEQAMPALHRWMVALVDEALRDEPPGQVRDDLARIREERRPK